MLASGSLLERRGRAHRTGGRAGEAVQGAGAQTVHGWGATLETGRAEREESLGTKLLLSPWGT